MQAIAMTLGCKTVAKNLGQRHNKSAGITPPQWLTQFGTSLNRGSELHDASRPLPLYCFASPGDRAMTSYDDGRACPSLQAFLEIEVQHVGVSVVGAEDFSNSRGPYGCRLRLLGNAMSRPPLEVGVLERVQTQQGSQAAVYRAVPDAQSDGAVPQLAQPKPTMYPVDHDLKTSLLAVEVRCASCVSSTGSHGTHLNTAVTDIQCSTACRIHRLLGVSP